MSDKPVQPMSDLTLEMIDALFRDLPWTHTSQVKCTDYLELRERLRIAEEVCESAQRLESHGYGVSNRRPMIESLARWQAARGGK